jgi:hypothetical protein
VGQYRTRLLTPPREEEEVYPYRRVWPAFALETGVLVVVTVVIFIAYEFLGVTLPDRLESLANLALALTPAGLWIANSYAGEQRVPEPRRRLLAVFIIAGLAANAVAIPLIEDVVRPHDWLPLVGTVDRIVGYMLTTGMVQAIVIYLVVRYVTWPDHLRIRLDLVAYCLAAAVAYITVFNLQFIGRGAPSLSVVAQNVLFSVAIYTGSAILISYGLAETRFNETALVAMPFSILMSALLIGIAIPLRSGIINPAFTLGVAEPRQLFGLAITFVLLVGPQIIMVFLFGTTERREIQQRMSDAVE